MLHALLYTTRRFRKPMAWGHFDFVLSTYAADIFEGLRDFQARHFRFFAARHSATVCQALI